MTTTSKTRITLFMNPLLAKQTKAQAVIEECTLTEFVEKALNQYLPKVTIIKKIDLKKVN